MIVGARPHELAELEVLHVAYRQQLNVSASRAKLGKASPGAAAELPGGAGGSEEKEEEEEAGSVAVEDEDDEDEAGVVPAGTHDGERYV